MAELATIARPYAEALFKAASADLNAAQLWVEELQEIAKNEQLQEFADYPKATSAQIFDVVSGVVKGGLPEMAKNFLRILIENGRLKALPEIAQQFRALKNARAGTSDAVVYSAYPIEGAQLAALVATLEKRFARKLNVRVQLQAELVGGIRVVVGDEVLDTSVKARLEQMKAELTA